MGTRSKRLPEGRRVGPAPAHQRTCQSSSPGMTDSWALGRRSDARTRCPCLVLGAGCIFQRAPFLPPVRTSAHTNRSTVHGGVPLTCGGHIWLSSSLHFSLCPYTRLLNALHLLRCDAPALSFHPLLLLFLLRHLLLPSIHLPTCLPRRPPQHPRRVPDERRAVARDTAAIVYSVAR